MSQGKSIFSAPNGSNGEAPDNPFASLGTGAQKGGGAASPASPFAAAAETTPAVEPESPFGFAAEEASPQAKAPEKSNPVAQPPAEDNPFLSASSATPPQAESSAPLGTETDAASSPFTSESSFEAGAQPSGGAFSAGDNPLSSASSEAGSAQNEQSRPAGGFGSPQAAAPAAEPAPVMSTPAAAAPPAAAPPVAVAASSPSSGSSSPTGTPSTRQLELRAIFGVEGEMTRDEILTRAKALPGIREVTVVGPAENAAVQTMGEVMARFGFGGAGAWQMSCSGGIVDFVSAERATIAVLREGRYAAGVWETLMIVTRELGKLS